MKLLPYEEAVKVCEACHEFRGTTECQRSRDEAGQGHNDWLACAFCVDYNDGEKCGRRCDVCKYLIVGGS